jgi:hypothetical protein
MRTVDVTAGDISLGQRTAGQVGAVRCGTCPVARAFQRTMDDPDAMWMYGWGASQEEVWVPVDQEGARAKIRDFMRAADRSAPLEPFSFEIMPRAAL